MYKKTIILLLAILIPISFLYSQTAQELYKQGISYLLKAKNISTQEDLNNSDIQKAIKIFRQVMKDYPQTRWAEMSQNQIAWTYYKGKAYAEAETEFLNLIESYPGSASVDDWQFNLGKINFSQKNYEDAKKKFQDVIDIYSSKQKKILKNRIPESYLMLAQCDLAQDKYGEAINGFNNFKDTFPDDSLVSKALAGMVATEYEQGYNNYQQENYNIALEYFNKAIDVYKINKSKYILSDEIFPGAYFMKAETKVKLGYKEEAIKILEELIKEFRRSPKTKEAKERIEELK